MGFTATSKRNIRRCSHVKTNGIQCGAPALRYRDYCHYHRQAYKDFPLRRVPAKPAVDPALNLGLMDDPDGIHYALTHIVYGLVNGTIERKTAGLALHALRTMSSNFKQTSFQRQLADEYRKSELNAYEIWEQMEREDQEEAQKRLHEKRIEELEKLERTCCKCRKESDDPASLTPPIPPPEPPAKPVAPPPREKQWWEIKACAEEAEVQVPHVRPIRVAERDNVGISPITAQPATTTTLSFRGAQRRGTPVATTKPATTRFLSSLAELRSASPLNAGKGSMYFSHHRTKPLEAPQVIPQPCPRLNDSHDGLG